MREIHGDRLEQSRIRLERDIDNNIPSPPSMDSDSRQDEADDVSSVEFARHNSNQHPSFHSFEHPSHLDSDFYSRHGDDDSIALDPDLGHTMSTAAHHASALTLSAGLRGRNSYNHTTGRASPTGVEYDPERPLQAMLDNRIADGISLFDATGRSKSKSAKSLKNDQTRSLPTFDPVIVDSTAELDRFLRTGHHRPNAVPRSGMSYPYISRSHSQPDPCASDASDSDASTPRLSQALGRHFSPKRPRSAPAPHSEPPARPENPTPSHAATVHPPKPIPKKPKPGPSNLNPAKPTAKRTTVEDASQPSQFSKIARGLAHDIEAQSRLLSRDQERENDKDATPRPPRRGIFPTTPAPVNAFPSVRESAPTKRPPFSDIVNKEHGDAKRRHHGHSSARVHLPDVTGLTSAVQSPVKGGAGYVSADAAHPSLAVDLLPALDALQTRLQSLERENGVSRRRVRELELELEECKAEVVKERTRVREREREQDEEVQWERERERERQVRGKMHEEGRYREVVEEKKALEALITTLRSHLARLTSELASHRSLIAGLRADTYAVGETHAEVEALRAEVERLAGEVERLKQVVEEGLRERRRARDGSDTTGGVSVDEKEEEVPAQVGIDLTYVTVPVSRVEEREEPITVEDLEPEEQEQEQEPEYESELEPEPEPVSSRTRRYIHAVELARVESEMRERRSERSLSTSKSNASGKSRDNDSGNGSSLHEVEAPTAVNAHAPPLPSITRDGTLQDQDPLRNALHPDVNWTRLHTSDRPAPAPRQRNITPPKQPAPSTPFPQIRGSRMERLFFSAPEHNARTCTVCHRRKRGGERGRAHQEEDEGFGEDEDEVVKTYLRNKAQRGKGRCRHGEMEDADGDRLPAQTVLARVVRELEDDFSHYKAIYLELAHQYGVMDAASNVAKRNVLADHLRDVIDTLEQKGDQIASLYELLNFEDKPLPRVPPKRAAFA